MSRIDWIYVVILGTFAVTCVVLFLHWRNERGKAKRVDYKGRP